MTVFATCDRVWSAASPFPRAAGDAMIIAFMPGTRSLPFATTPSRLLHDRGDGVPEAAPAAAALRGARDAAGDGFQDRGKDVADARALGGRVIDAVRPSIIPVMAFS